MDVHADADWVKIADLAANRGMGLHFHISCQFDPSPGAATLRRQRDLLMPQHATCGAVVNAADPSAMSKYPFNRALLDAMTVQQ